MRTEAELLNLIESAPTLEEQRRYVAELMRFRKERTAAVEAERQLDLANAYIRDITTPASVHELHTASTDWLGEVAASSGDYNAEIRAKATLWFKNLHPAVKADRDEFSEQAMGMARRESGRFGEYAEAAYDTFLRHVGHLYKKAQDEFPPGEVDVEQSGNAESTVTDYDTEGSDPEPMFAEDFDGEDDTGSQIGSGVHPEMPGASGSDLEPETFDNLSTAEARRKTAVQIGDVVTLKEGWAYYNTETFQTKIGDGTERGTVVKGHEHPGTLIVQLDDGQLVSAAIAGMTVTASKTAQEWSGEYHPGTGRLQVWQPVKRGDGWAVTDGAGRWYAGEPAMGFTKDSEGVTILSNDRKAETVAERLNDGADFPIKTLGRGGGAEIGATEYLAKRAFRREAGLREEYLDEAGGDPVKAAILLAGDLMVGDPETFRGGYSLDNAILAAIDIFPEVTPEQISPRLSNARKRGGLGEGRGGRVREARRKTAASDDTWAVDAWLANDESHYRATLGMDATRLEAYVRENEASLRAAFPWFESFDNVDWAEVAESVNEGVEAKRATRKTASTAHTLADPNVWKQLEALPRIGATDGQKGDRPAVKLFDPYGSAWWVLWEYDPSSKEAFGYAELFPGGGELGYVSVAELAELAFMGQKGLRIERDAGVTTMVEGFKSRGATPPGFLMTGAKHSYRKREREGLIAQGQSSGIFFKKTARLETCRNCGATIDTSLGAEAPTGEYHEGTSDDPRPPGETDDICDICEYGGQVWANWRKAARQTTAAFGVYDEWFNEGRLIAGPFETREEAAAAMRQVDYPFTFSEGPETVVGDPYIHTFGRRKTAVSIDWGFEDFVDEASGVASKITMGLGDDGNTYTVYEMNDGSWAFDIEGVIPGGYLTVDGFATEEDAKKAAESGQRSTTASRKTAEKYRAEVAGVGEDTWSSNALEYDTPEEAKAWLTGLSGRWFGYDMSRVVPVSTPKNEPVDPSDPAIFQNFRSGSRKQTLRKRKATRKTAFTVRDIARLLLREDHLGWGYASSHGLTLEQKEALDEAVAQVATELGLSEDDFFMWLNSRPARWLLDAATMGGDPVATVKKYLNASEIADLRAEGRKQVTKVAAYKCGYCAGTGVVSQGAPGMDLGPGFPEFLPCPFCKGTGEVTTARDRDRKPYLMHRSQKEQRVSRKTAIAYGDCDACGRRKISLPFEAENPEGSYRICAICATGYADYLSWSHYLDELVEDGRVDVLQDEVDALNAEILSGSYPHPTLDSAQISRDMAEDALRRAKERVTASRMGSKRKARA